MGTNYYVTKNGPSVQTPFHIGKSSCGWLFNFQYQGDTWCDPPVVWNSYEELLQWLQKYTVDNPEYVIIDESDEVISLDDFKDMVEFKQNDERCRNNPDNFHYSDNVNGYRFTRGEFS